MTMLLSLPPDKLRRLAQVNRDTADELDKLADQVQAALDDGAEIVEPVGGMSEPDLERLRRIPGEAPTLPQAFQALRDAGGDGWDKVDDPAALLGRADPALAMDTPEMMVRGGGSSRGREPQ